MLSNLLQLVPEMSSFANMDLQVSSDYCRQLEIPRQCMESQLPHGDAVTPGLCQAPLAS